jgi:hypothetical protein
MVQMTGNGVVSTKATQLEVKEFENGNASKSREVILNGHSREPSHEFIYGMILAILIFMLKSQYINKFSFINLVPQGNKTSHAISICQ